MRFIMALYCMTIKITLQATSSKWRNDPWEKEGLNSVYFPGPPYSLRLLPGSYLLFYLLFNVFEQSLNVVSLAFIIFLNYELQGIG